ncbi:hypothetical protein [Xanthomonas phage JGB6]|nr:hypothetical protein [Xanthomonas phage JGB6]
MRVIRTALGIMVEFKNGEQYHVAATESLREYTVTRTAPDYQVMQVSVVEKPPMHFFDNAKRSVYTEQGHVRDKATAVTLLALCDAYDDVVRNATTLRRTQRQAIASQHTTRATLRRTHTAFKFTVQIGC